MYENSSEFFYHGGKSSLESESSETSGRSELYTGYSFPAAQLGSPTSIQTANQVSEVSSRLNEGVKTVEMQPIQPEIFETIPKQHFKEIERLSKLTGTEMTVHAPMIDPSGFTKEGWSEQERQMAEKQLLSVVERSHEVSPTGHMPITIHASGLPGTEYMKGLPVTDEQIKMYGLPESAKEEAAMFAVNRDTGQIIPVRLEKRFYPEENKERWNTPRENIRMINNGEWQEKLIRMEQYKKMSDELREPALYQMQAISDVAKGTGKLTAEEHQQYDAARAKLEQSDKFIEDVGAVLRTSYSNAYKYTPEKARVRTEDGRIIEINPRKELEKVRQNYVDQLDAAEKSNDRISYIQKRADAMRTLLDGMTNVHPETYQPIEDFAKEKASETLGNVAFNAYKQFKQNTPIMSIENLYPGMSFSRADQLKGLVEASRDKFVENAVKSGMGKSEAREQAEKIIGVTWDVGHLNQLRKGGFTEEDLVRESAKIAPYVKHVHLTDNFGFSDSHLPPGMANVPIKGIMTELDKAGYKGKGIVEAGAFVQHFKTSPHPYALEALGSPMYSAVMQPSWEESRGSFGAYFGGYGTMLPEQHFSMYGSGFSALPSELGGQIPGKQSRLSGAPME